MNDRITIGAAFLRASLAGLTMIGRMWPAPTVRAVDDCTLDELLPPWTDEAPSHGVLVQALKWCPHCIRVESVVRNKDGWLCTWCTQPIPADGVGAAPGGAL